MWRRWARCATARNSTATLQGAALPALIIVGEDDALTTPSDAAAMQAALPGARLVRIAGAAHLSALEQPAAVSAALREFLDGLG